MGWDSVGRVGVGLSGLAMVEGGGDWGVGMHTRARANDVCTSALA